MALNKRILDRIQGRCQDDDALLDYLREIIRFELSESKQYTKEYEAALRKCAKRVEGRRS